MSKNLANPLLSSTPVSAAKATNNISQGKKIAMIIGLAVFGIFAILGLISFISGQKNNGDVVRVNKENKENKAEIALINEKVRSLSNQRASDMKRGDQGPPGIQGPPGPTGGVHAAAGPLLCVGQKKVATPTYGTSAASIIYLDERRYTPLQYWTLQNNPDNSVSIVNKFTQYCMTYNDNFEIYNQKCENKENQKFTWGNNMTLSPFSKLTEQCISIENKFPMSDMNNNKYNLDTNTVEDKTASGEVSKLLLKKCSTGYDANQTWWIGN